MVLERSVPEKAAGWQAGSPLFELNLFAGYDHVASTIENANHGMM
jgi:hypothetical protein